MITPSWFSNVLAAAMLMLSAYSISRVVVARRWRHRVDVDVEITHSLMGLSMAGMLERGLTTLPDGTWAIIFVASGTWFAARWLIARQLPGFLLSAPSHVAPHMVASGSMVYMLKAMPSWSGMAGLICGSHMMGMSTMDMTPTKWPIVGFALAAMLIGGAATVAYRQFRPLVHRPLGHPDQPLSVQHSPSLETFRHHDAIGGGTHGVDLLDPVVASGHLGPAVELAPRAAVICQIAMALTMGYMLICML